MATTTIVSCHNCKFKMELMLPEEDDYDPMEITCSKCNQVFYIERVEVV
jgi:hypothetical protein